jgi:hypothetical protein
LPTARQQSAQNVIQQLRRKSDDGSDVDDDAVGRYEVIGDHNLLHPQEVQQVTGGTVDPAPFLGKFNLWRIVVAETPFSGTSVLS